MKGVGGCVGGGGGGESVGEDWWRKVGRGRERAVPRVLISVM